MIGIIDFIFTYVLLLAFWLIINCFFYALSIITKKGFFFIPFAINTLLSWVIQIFFIIYPLYLIWQIIVAREWLFLIFFLILGGLLIGFWQAIIGFVLMPINGITMYFSEKAAKKLDQKEENYDYEVISPDGEVIGKFQSWDKTHKDLAKWFVISFSISFVGQFIKSPYEEWLGLMWYFIIPMLVLISTSIVLAFFVGIYNLVRKRKFFGGDKYQFLTKTLKIYSIIYGLDLVYGLLFRLR